MATILDTIAEYARERVAQEKKTVSLADLRAQVEQLPKTEPFRFEKALATKDIAFICECKKASPSKGVIAEAYDYLTIARQYEAAGAACISVLTEPKWFLGSDAHLQAVTSAVTIPCIRKDFVVDAYMIYKAKLLGEIGRAHV